MFAMNYFIQSLLEAENKNAAGEGTDDNATEDTGGDNPDTAENQTDTTDQNQNEEQTQDKEQKENQDDNKGEDESNDDGLGDDFDLDPDGGSGDEDNSEEPPDGLTSPDDDGSSNTSTDEVETNIQTNILNLSKLDRTIAKRRLFTNFQDLRTQINTFRNIIANNEENIEVEIREKIYADIDKAYSSITDYMTYKFSFINYEENLQAYLLFSKMVQDIVNYTSTNATKSSRKSKVIKDTE